MPISINKLLNKKSWKGAEVGKALVLSCIHDIKMQGKEDYVPLFTQADFDRMYSTISTEKDWQEYEAYLNLYNYLMQTYNEGLSLHQQFGNGYYRYKYHITTLFDMEKAKKNEELTPLVMTPTEYWMALTKAENNLSNKKESFESLMVKLLEYSLKGSGNAPADIAQAIEATKAEKLTDEDVIKDYFWINDICCYELPTGERSDQYSAEEWEQLVKDKVTEHFQKTVDAVRDLQEEANLAPDKLDVLSKFSFTQIVLFLKKEALDRSYKMFYNGLPEDIVSTLNSTPEEAEKMLYNLIEEDSEVSSSDLDNLDWCVKYLQAKKIYNTDTDALTKYDALVKCLDYYTTTDYFFTDSFVTEHYPALYKALEKHIKAAVPQAKKIKSSNYMDTFISWKELAELNFLDFEQRIKATDIDIAETFEDETIRRRIEKGGLSVLTGSSYERKRSGSSVNLGTVFTKSDEKIENLPIYVNELIKPAMLFIECFNKLNPVLAEIFDLPELADVNIETLSYKAKINTCNDLIYNYYYNVYGTEEEKAEKRKIIKQYIPIITLDDVIPQDKYVNKVRKDIAKVAFTKDLRDKLRYYDSLYAEMVRGGN